MGSFAPVEQESLKKGGKSSRYTPKMTSYRHCLTLLLIAVFCTITIDATFFSHSLAADALKDSYWSAQRIIVLSLSLLFVCICMMAFWRFRSLRTLNNELSASIAEQKRIASDLKKSEKALRNAHEIAGLGRWEMDLASDRLIWSEGIYRLLEVDPEEFTASHENFFTYVHPDDQPYLDEQQKQSVINGALYQVEYRLLMHDGRVKWGNEIGRTVYDEKGNPLRSSGTIQDITEIKRVEAALYESEEKYRSIFAAENDAIFLIDKLTGTILEVNNAACDIYGYSQSEMVRLNNVDVSAEPEKTTQATVEVQKAIPLRYHRRKGGAIFPVDISSSSFVLQGREVILAVIRDISERRKVEEALQQSEDRLKMSLAGADLGMWDWNVVDGSVVFNERWAEMLGYSLDELEPNLRTWENMVHPDDMPQIQQTLTAHLKGETESYKVEHRLRHKEGQWVWVLDCGRVIQRDLEGKPLRACGTHLNISERKKSDEEREKLISDLKDALGQVKKLSGMLPICSHCKKIRDDKGYWNTIENYIHDHSEAEFSHSICRECADKLYPELHLYEDRGS